MKMILGFSAWNKIYGDTAVDINMFDAAYGVDPP
jgi:hypothetical protein